MSSTLNLSALLLAAALSAGSAAADGLVFTGALTEGDTTQADRHTRSGDPSECGAVRAFAGAFASGQQHRFDTHTFTNDSAFSRCFSIRTFSQAAGGNTVNAFTIGYTGSYDPNNKGVNYAGDPSDSASGTAWEIDVPAGGTIVLVVEQVNNTLAVDSYRVVVSSARNEGVSWTDAKAGVLQQWDFTDDSTFEFDSYEVASPFGSFVGWTLADCCDLNGDGEQDFVFKNAKLGLIGVSIGTTASIGSPQRFQILGSVLKEQEFVCCADVDADGDGDLIQRNTKTNEVAFWILEDGVFDEELLLQDPLLEGFSIAVCCDLDADGDADFVWTQPKTGLIRVWNTDGANPGNPSLFDVEITAATPGPDSLVLTQTGWILTCCRGGRLVWFHTKTRGVVDWTFGAFSGGGLAQFAETVLADEAGGPLFLPKGVDIFGCGDFDGSDGLDLFVRNTKSLQVGWFADYDGVANTLLLRGPDPATTSAGLTPLSAEESARVGNKKFEIRCPLRNTRKK